MSKISENKPERIAKIVAKWKNYSKVGEKLDKQDSPLTCSHDHCIFWRNKSAVLKKKIKEEED